MRALTILSFLVLAETPGDIAEEDALNKAGAATASAEGALDGTNTAVGEAKIVNGGCSAQDPQKQEAVDCASGQTSGYIEAGTGVTNVYDCATVVKEGCEDAKFISFHAGEDGYHDGVGICAWFTTCDCWSKDTCIGGTTETGTQLTVKKQTGEIKDLTTNHPNGIPKVVEPGTEGGDDENRGEDPNYIKAMTDAILNDAAEPTKMPLDSLPSAAEEDMEGAERDQESLNVGETEHSCPGREIAVFRGEWQCILKGGMNTGLVAGYMGGVLAVAGGIALKLHMVGAEKRSHGVAVNPMDSDKGED